MCGIKKEPQPVYPHRRQIFNMRGSRNFRKGGGGVQVSLLKKKGLTTFFFFFFSPQLILQKSNGQFQRNLSLFKVPEGVQHFPGGGGGSNFFQGGSNCLFPIESHISCDFQGCPDPLPPSGSALVYNKKERSRSDWINNTVWSASSGADLGFLEREVHMYIGVGIRFADFLICLKYPMKIK